MYLADSSSLEWSWDPFLAITIGNKEFPTRVVWTMAVIPRYCGVMSAVVLKLLLMFQ